MAADDDALTPLIDKGIGDGDWGPFLGAVLGARFDEDEGRFCQCPEPLTERGRGKSTMCRRCLLTNQARLEEVNGYIRAPHLFEQDRDPNSAAAWAGMCSWCSGWRDDPRHVVYSLDATTGNRSGSPRGGDPIHPEGIYQCNGCGRTYPEYVNGCVEDHEPPRKVVLMVDESAAGTPGETP